MQTWEEPTNLFIDGRSRSSVELLSPCCCFFHKSFPANKTKTIHACYWSTRGLEVKHKSDDIDEIYIFRDGKSIFFININTNQLTMISEIGHRSSILILGSSSSFCPPTAAAWVSPRAWGKAKGLGTKLAWQFGRVSLLWFSSFE